MAPKGRKRRREDGAPWWAEKSTDLILGCFRKELALFLKTDFVETDSSFRRKVFVFRRNYFEVPDLKHDVEYVLNDINNILKERLHDLYLKDMQPNNSEQNIRSLLMQHEAADADVHVATEVLSPFLPSLSEQKNFLKLSFPACWTRFGEKDTHRKLKCFEKVRQNVVDWWKTDVRGWVERAELEVSASQMSRILFDGSDDHLELKVSGLGKTCFFLMSEQAELEELADLVEEKMLAKTCEEKGIEDTYFGSWLIKIVDGVRKARAGELLRDVLAFQGAPSQNAPLDKLDLIKLLEEGSLSKLQHLQVLLDSKAVCGIIPDADARRLRNACKSCLPYERFASCNDELDCSSGTDEYLRDSSLCVLLGPEDLPFLAHTEQTVSVELKWIKLWEPPYKVEVVARVPEDWTRPYAISRQIKRRRQSQADSS